MGAESIAIHRTFRAALGALTAFTVLLPAASPAAAPPSPFDDCEARFTADPRGWKTCACFHRVATATGLRDEAMARLEAHRTTDPDNPCLAWTLGRLLLEDRNAERAALLLREAAGGYRDRGLADGEVYSRITLSEALFSTGASGKEITEQLDRARAAAKRSGDPVLDAEVAVQEAEILLLRGGELDLVEAALREVRREALPRAHASLRGSILSKLGAVLYRRGRFAEAEEAYAEMAQVTAGAGLRFAEAAARVNRAAAAGAGRPGPARAERVVRLLDEAVAAAREAGHPFAEIEARKRLGRLAGGPEGREHFELALELAEEYRDRAPELLAGVLAASAVGLLDDDPREARRRVDEASALLLETDDPWQQAYGWADRLRVLWATAPREEALATARSTLAIADRLAQIQETEGTRAEVFAVWTEIYQWLAGRLLTDAEADPGFGLDPGSVPRALARAHSVAERMRARLLLESLAAAGVQDATRIAPIDRKLDGGWRELQTAIVGVHRRLLDPRLAPERRAELLARLKELELEEDRLAARRRRPRRSITAGPEDLAAPESFVGLDELRAVLAPDEALLTFQVGLWESLDGSFNGGSWLVTATRDRVRVHRLPGRAEIEPVVRVFLHLFERRDGSEAEPAVALYDALLRDALDSLPPGIERLVLVPDGPLHLLPFAALRTAPDALPLAARYELFATPSATVWHRLRSLGEGGDLALALADPASPTDPANAPAGEALVARTERSWTAGARFPNLPRARREGREALRQLGEPGRLLVGAAATERAVKTDAARGLRLLHLGTHAVLDEAYPHRSAVVLAPGSPDEDGLLRPREAADLALDGAVVVLASCQSASGTVLQGEGALSLARAFLQGGARAVVGSLWPVTDAEAAELLGRFYHHLGRGTPVAGALTRAQREALDAGAPAVAWAGWTVLGDGGAVVAPEGRPEGGASAQLEGWLARGAGVALVLALVAAAAAIVRRVA